MDYFSEIFSKLPRLGPGSDESTLKAAKILPAIKNADILDIGCGNGSQTITLAKAFGNSKITAIDIDNIQIERLKIKVDQLMLNEQINVMNMSMHDLKFEEESFEIIWSEGAIYNIGFKNGLSAWKKYLKKGGFVVCSEISWISEPCLETEKYWKKQYSEIDYLDKNLIKIKECGYDVINFYISPKSDWLANYYEPMKKELKIIGENYADNSDAQRIVNNLTEEYEMFRDHCDEYSYVFYIMKKK